MRNDIDSIRHFAREVERRAEANMLRTHKLEGMHYAALKEVLAEWETNLTPLTEQERSEFTRGFEAMRLIAQDACAGVTMEALQMFPDPYHQGRAEGAGAVMEVIADHIVTEG